ncbi:cell envelope integrity protein TolA [Rhizobium hainanense]|uniref:Protein TonB n=1 Tax=Rhizobium hainanense TaxID=52131 RepID=A0A1C3U5X0_9HYPH|nr:cell envelope integrity protein TolA [Rhizobium hainanense]SCB10874.1 protein TonB [Rhizobium hainanense]
MAMRSVKVSMERRANGGLNDNYPSVLPGHELAGLEGVPRPPAAEAVAHYSRFTQISSYPDHPSEAAPVETAEHLPMDAQPERLREASTGRKASLLFSGIGSCLFHAAIVTVLLFAFVAAPEDAQEEAGDTVSVIMIGNSDADQMAMGEENPQTEPEQVTAEAVQPQTVQPNEVTPEQAQPPQPDVVQPQEVETQQVQAAEAVQPVEQTQPPEVAPEQPQILATQAPSETTVIQPAEPVQPVQNDVVEAQPVETQPEVVKPVERPKPVEKPKVVKKPVPKIAKVKSGSRGENEQDSKRGSVDGAETAQSDANSQLTARKTGSGDAAIANYTGKVQARIKRYVQRVPSTYGKGLTLVVRLTIGSNGELRSLSAVRSSGDSGLDQAVLEQVRNAAPFPSLPSEWGKPTWTFTQPVQVGGR